MWLFIIRVCVVYYCVVATVYLPYNNHCILWESTILQWTKSRKAAFGFLRSYMHDLADLSHNANRMTSLKLSNSEQIVIQCRFDLIGNFSLLIHDLISFILHYLTANKSNITFINSRKTKGFNSYLLMLCMILPLRSPVLSLCWKCTVVCVKLSLSSPFPSLFSAVSARGENCYPASKTNTSLLKEFWKITHSSSSYQKRGVYKMSDFFFVCFFICPLSITLIVLKICIWIIMCIQLLQKFWAD